VLTRAGLPPEVLQLNVFDRDGRWIARVDMAWIGRRVVIEVDGLEYHETPEAVLRDRDKQNRLAGAGWTLLRFTWFDIVRQPEYVIARVRAGARLRRLTESSWETYGCQPQSVGFLRSFGRSGRHQVVRRTASITMAPTAPMATGQKRMGPASMPPCLGGRRAGAMAGMSRNG
jgi:hypothetical protein